MVEDVTETPSVARQASVLLRPGFHVALFVLLAAILVAAVRIPPILDFPNHFARIFLIAGGIDQPFFSSAYALDWNRARTNVGIDLLAFWIGPLVGPELLARTLLFLAIVLPPLGAVALNRRLFGGSRSFQVAILFLAWSATLVGGFINFQIGLGLALIFVLVDLRIGQARPLLLNLWRAAACFLLTIDHVFAAGFYLVLSAGLELPASFRDFTSRSILGAAARRIAIGGVVGLIPVATLMLGASGLPGDGQGIGTVWNTPGLALSNLLSAVTSYITVLDIALFVPIIVIIVEARSRQRMRVHAGLVVATGLLFFLSLLAPRHLMGTGWISWRFPIMTLLAGAAAICPFPDTEGKVHRRMVAVSAIVVFLRTAVVAALWCQGNQDATAVQRVLAFVPADSKVLPVTHRPVRWPGLRHASRYFFWNEDTIRHLPTLATPDAGAFVPTLFTAIGKQPLEAIGDFRSMTVPEGNLLSVGSLFCESMQRFYLNFTPYLADWRQRFDYVLVVNADLPDRYVGAALPDRLTKVADADFAVLYAIDKADTAPRFGNVGECPAPQGWYDN